MTTVQDIVSRALRLLRVLDVNSAPKAVDMQTGIVALNAMMRRWEANGLALGWSTVVNPADTLPLPEEAEEAVAYNLALRLRAEYGTSLDPDVAAMAADGLNLLRRDRVIASPIEYGRCGTHYDITTDSYV